MSTIWHPYTEPPNDSRRVRLRFDDDGKRDCNGFYAAAFGGYYKGKTGFYQHSPVHPTHWAELEEEDT